ncbi:MAG: GWxTD domain-containing protein [Bacteroidia bacterium]
MKKIVFILIIPLVFFAACTISTKISNQNLSDIYHKDGSFLHPKYLVYHTSDSVSELYFKIETAELLYAHEFGNSSTLYTARVKLNYQLFSGYDSKIIIDSASIFLSDSTRNAEMIGHVEIKIPFGKAYLLQLNLTDLNKHTTETSYENVYKTNHFDEQSFLLCEKNTGIPLFRNYLYNGESVSLKTNRTDCKTIFGRYYNRSFPSAAPPFAVMMNKPFHYKPDSLFSLQQNKNGDFTFTAKNFTSGFFNFAMDTTKKYGITLFGFDDDFPHLTTAKQLLDPLCYICTREEYKEISSDKNTKKAVDSFWLQLAGNPDRAKEIIRKYYNRVQDANIFFTSYLEGWKTDRGMIYLIYGQPNVVYRTENSESWVYGEENNMMSLTFTFVKVTNPFSENDYTLDRSSIYKISWYNTVDYWRQGKVYLQN